jgi:hypothetical protein
MVSRGVQAEQRVPGRPAGPVAFAVEPDVELRREAHRPVEFHHRPEQRSLLKEVERLAGVEAATEALQPMVQRRLPSLVVVSRRRAA